ncbi:MAG: hypothetical protein IJK78_14070 [Bacteroidales bacterium]|jgi:hypothetical protein|nr:hypothetical protein [Bacteroidales bacterium]
MAQVEMTVSMDSRRQEQIDRFCAISGLSRKQTFNEMMDMWERLVYIPWIEFLEKEEQRRKAREGFNAIRAKAERGEYPDLTMEEINEEIAKARAEKRQKENQG